MEMNIKQIIAEGEKETVEFKEQVPSDYKRWVKSIIAFANGDGGLLLFGVTDKRELKGIDSLDVFKTEDAIVNTIADSCEPLIVPTITIHNIDEKNIIAVDVPRGIQKPYYLKSVGLKEGTFIRSGATTRQAEPHIVKGLVIEGENLSYDQLPTKDKITNDEIDTFCRQLYEDALNEVQDSERIKIKEVKKGQLLSWQLIKEDKNDFFACHGLKILRGDWIDGWHHYVQCAVFRGKTRGLFITKKDVAGSLYEQLNDAYNFVLQNIDIYPSFKGLKRIEEYELPTKSIREVIANALCHRDYLQPSNIQVAIYEDRLEISSPGRLVNGITLANIKSGVSKTRNRGIAETFAYMGVVEKWGSGIPNLYKEAKEFGLKNPVIEMLGDEFRVTIFRNRSRRTDLYGLSQSSNTVSEETTPLYKSMKHTNMGKESRTYNAIVANPTITIQELSKQLTLSEKTINQDLAALKKLGAIKRVGGLKFGHWEASDSVY